jgi:Tol biopolymer transport system component
VPAIAFDSQSALDGSDALNTNGAQNIWAVGADGTGLTPLTKLTAQGVISHNPAWSPDGSTIAFDSNRAEDGSDALSTISPNSIWAINADGSDARTLASVSDGSFHAYVFGPEWSPNGLELALTSVCCLDLYSNVAVINADGSGLTVLTEFGGVPTTGTTGSGWSSDGLKLLFDTPGTYYNFPAPPSNVWVVNADGSNQQQLTSLTSQGADCRDEKWSPDGSQIVFASTRALDASDFPNANTTSNIWVMNADGSAVRPLTTLTAPGSGSTVPTWSPDGSKIAFESSRALDGSDAANLNTTVNIWVMNNDGTGATPLTKLTAAGAGSSGADWSMTGSQLAFESTRALDGSDSANAACNIWVMNVDGSNASPFTKNKVAGIENLQPKWRP